MNNKTEKRRRVKINRNSSFQIENFESSSDLLLEVQKEDLLERYNFTKERNVLESFNKGIELSDNKFWQASKVTFLIAHLLGRFDIYEKINSKHEYTPNISFAYLIGPEPERKPTILVDISGHKKEAKEGYQNFVQGIKEPNDEVVSYLNEKLNTVLNENPEDPIDLYLVTSVSKNSKQIMRMGVEELYGCSEGAMAIELTKLVNEGYTCLGTAHFRCEFKPDESGAHLALQEFFPQKSCKRGCCARQEEDKKFFTQTGIQRRLKDRRLTPPRGTKLPQHQNFFSFDPEIMNSELFSRSQNPDQLKTLYNKINQSLNKIEDLSTKKLVRKLSFMFDADQETILEAASASNMVITPETVSYFFNQLLTLEEKIEHSFQSYLKDTCELTSSKQILTELTTLKEQGIVEILMRRIDEEINESTLHPRQEALQAIAENQLEKRLLKLFYNKAIEHINAQDSIKNLKKYRESNYGLQNISHLFDEEVIDQSLSEPLNKAVEKKINALKYHELSSKIHCNNDLEALFKIAAYDEKEDLELTSKKYFVELQKEASEKYFSLLIDQVISNIQDGQMDSQIIEFTHHSKKTIYDYALTDLTSNFLSEPQQSDIQTLMEKNNLQLQGNSINKLREAIEKRSRFLEKFTLFLDEINNKSDLAELSHFIGKKTLKSLPKKSRQERDFFSRFKEHSIALLKNEDNFFNAVDFLNYLNKTFLSSKNNLQIQSIASSTVKCINKLLMCEDISGNDNLSNAMNALNYLNELFSEKNNNLPQIKNLLRDAHEHISTLLHEQIDRCSDAQDVQSIRSQLMDSLADHSEALKQLKAELSEHLENKSLDLLQEEALAKEESKSETSKVSDNITLSDKKTAFFNSVEEKSSSDTPTSQIECTY